MVEDGWQEWYRREMMLVSYFAGTDARQAGDNEAAGRGYCLESLGEIKHDAHLPKVEWLQGTVETNT